MTGRKRSFGAVAAGDVLVIDYGSNVLTTEITSPLKDAQTCSKDQHKRLQTCTCSVGSMSEPELAQFIHQLGPHISANSAVLQTHAGLDAAGLQAFAELNTVLQQHFIHLSGSMLKGYHSFTTQDRQR